MPPKKAAGDTEPISSNNEASENKFSWTPQNDRTLLLLTLGRNPAAEDYQRFVDALPVGTSINGVKIRYSRLRMEMKKRYEELGWEVPESMCSRTTPRKSKIPVTPKKRKGSEEESAEIAEDPETPVKAKKLRAKKEEGKKKGTKSEKMARVKDDGEVSSDDRDEECEIKEEDDEAEA